MRTALRQHRADDEKDSEFLASTDNWFRPVQARTGPDGALYVVDMYRFVIEHPRWIPAARLAQLDVRAGAGKGRIYRVVPAGKSLRPIRDLTKLSASKLAAALDSPNGTERDRVQIELLLRHDKASIPSIEKLASKASLPQVRVQALSVLEGLDALKPDLVEKALKDSDVHVRQQAIRLCETFFKSRSSDKTYGHASLAGERFVTDRPATIGLEPWRMERSASRSGARIVGRVAPCRR